MSRTIIYQCAAIMLAVRVFRKTGIFVELLFVIYSQKYIKQGVALTGRNRSGPPCSVGRPTAHAPGRQRADLLRAWRYASPPDGSVTDDDRRHMPASKTILAH